MAFTHSRAAGMRISAEVLPMDKQAGTASLPTFAPLTEEKDNTTIIRTRTYHAKGWHKFDKAWTIGFIELAGTRVCSSIQ